MRQAAPPSANKIIVSEAQELLVAAEVARLWHITLQRAMARVAHDVKDAINGVSVNLEVIRTRAARPDAPASAVLQFSESATQQLERLTILTEAVLALGRAERSPVDVRLTLRRVASVCGASSGAADALVRVEAGDSSESATSSVNGDAVRLALASAMLALAVNAHRGAKASEVVCTLAQDGDYIMVTIAAGGRTALLAPAVEEAVRSAGIRITENENAMIFGFLRV